MASLDRRTLDSFLDDQSRRWRQGARVLVETYLQREPALAEDSEAVLDLVYHEVQLRRRRGETPQLDEYIARFPLQALGLCRQFEVQETFESVDSARIHGPTWPAPTDHPVFPSVSGYEIQAELGRGGMGVVYRARQVRLNRSCALKMILAGALADEESTVRFLAEAEVIARLQHPNVVQIHHIGEAGGLPYFELELVEGGSLDQRMDGTPWVISDACQLIEETARGVTEAHRLGIVHRDLKPANILVTLDGTPKTTDFGLARILAADGGLTRSESILGSPCYMAPEQAEGRARQAGPPADVYALGSILYELLTGRPPFKAATVLETLELVKSAEPVPPARLQPGLPRDLETICLKCLVKDPSRRYSRADDLAADLRRFLDNRPIEARRVGSGERLVRWCRRNRTLAALSTSVALLILGFGIVLPVATVLHAERNAALANLTRAQIAEGKLRREHELATAAAHLAEARASRWSGKIGQRLRSLDELAAAARFAPTLELRNEAIACLALTDVRMAKSWVGRSPDGCAWVMDRKFQREARSDARGNIEVNHIAEDSSHPDRINLPGPGSHAFTLKFSFDGSYLAAIYADGRHGCQIWDVARRQVMLKRPIRGLLDFSADGRFIALSMGDGMIRIINVASGNDEKVIRSSPGGHYPVFDPTGRLLASTNDTTRRSVDVYELSTGAKLHTLTIGAECSGPPGWSQDSRYLAVPATDQSVNVWDLANQSVQAILVGHELRPNGAVFGPSGNLLATTGWDTTLRLWEPLTGRPLLRMDGGGGLPQFHPDKPWLGTTQTSDRVELWEIISGSEACRTLAPPSEGGGLESLEFDKDGRIIGAAGSQGVRLWDWAATREVAVLPDGQSFAAFDPFDGSLLTGGEKGLVRWPVRTAPTKFEDVVTVGPPQRLFESPDVRGVRPISGQRWLAVADRGSGKVLLIDPAEPGQHVILGEDAKVSQIAVSPDGRWVATGTSQGVGTPAKVWDTRSQTLAWQMPTEIDRGNANVLFSPDSRWLVTGSERKYQFFETGSWKPGISIDRDHAGFTLGAMAFTKDATILAINGSARLVRLIEVATGRELASLEALNPRIISHLAFSPDDGLLAVGHEGSIVLVWDLRYIRRQLTSIGLDWEGDPLPPVAEVAPRLLRGRILHEHSARN